jgi:hypothetical protein
MSFAVASMNRAATARVEAGAAQTTADLAEAEAAANTTGLITERETTVASIEGETLSRETAFNENGIGANPRKTNHSNPVSGKQEFRVRVHEDFSTSQNVSTTEADFNDGTDAVAYLYTNTDNTAFTMDFVDTSLIIPENGRLRSRPIMRHTEAAIEFKFKVSDIDDMVVTTDANNNNVNMKGSEIRINNAEVNGIKFVIQRPKIDENTGLQEQNGGSLVHTVKYTAVLYRYIDLNTRVNQYALLFHIAGQPKPFNITQSFLTNNNIQNNGEPAVFNIFTTTGINRLGFGLVADGIVVYLNRVPVFASAIAIQDRSNLAIDIVNKHTGSLNIDYIATDQARTFDDVEKGRDRKWDEYDGSFDTHRGNVGSDFDVPEFDMFDFTTLYLLALFMKAVEQKLDGAIDADEVFSSAPPMFSPDGSVINETNISQMVTMMSEMDIPPNETQMIADRDRTLTVNTKIIATLKSILDGDADGTILSSITALITQLDIYRTGNLSSTTPASAKFTYRIIDHGADIFTQLINNGALPKAELTSIVEVLIANTESNQPNSPEWVNPMLDIWDAYNTNNDPDIDTVEGSTTYTLAEARTYLQGNVTQGSVFNGPQHSDETVTGDHVLLVTKQFDHSTGALSNVQTIAYNGPVNVEFPHAGREFTIPDGSILFVHQVDPYIDSANFTNRPNAQPLNNRAAHKPYDGNVSLKNLTSDAEVVSGLGPVFVFSREGVAAANFAGQEEGQGPAYTFYDEPVILKSADFTDDDFSTTLFPKQTVFNPNTQVEETVFTRKFFGPVEIMCGALANPLMVNFDLIIDTATPVQGPNFYFGQQFMNRSTIVRDQGVIMNNTTEALGNNQAWSISNNIRNAHKFTIAGDARIDTISVHMTSTKDHTNTKIVIHEDVQFGGHNNQGGAGQSQIGQEIVEYTFSQVNGNVVEYTYTGDNANEKILSGNVGFSYWLEIKGNNSATTTYYSGTESNVQTSDSGWQLSRGVYATYNTELNNWSYFSRPTKTNIMVKLDGALVESNFEPLRVLIEDVTFTLTNADGITRHGIENIEGNILIQTLGYPEAVPAEYVPGQN